LSNSKVLAYSDSRAGGVAQAVEHLPNNCEAISSNPSTTKKERKARSSPEAGGKKKQNSLHLLSDVPAPMSELCTMFLSLLCFELLINILGLYLDVSYNLFLQFSTQSQGRGFPLLETSFRRVLPVLVTHPLITSRNVH
jgi:hypothetical protein